MVDCVCLLMQKLKFSFLTLIEHIKFVDQREGEMGKVSVRRKGGKGIKILKEPISQKLRTCAPANLWGPSQNCGLEEVMVERQAISIGRVWVKIGRVDGKEISI